MLSVATPPATPAPRPESLPAQIDLDLVQRFDKLGPRYTSYPTADRFVEAYDEQSFRQAMRTRLIGAVRQPLSLYVHLPFCNTICFYCGCNKVVTRDKSRAARYLHYLSKEVQMQAELAGDDRRVRQMHWGGGTPTFLSDHEMRVVWDMLRAHFEFQPDGEYAIEVDPRSCSPETIRLLAELGLNRASFGVQDFDPAVQRAVNRIQPQEMTVGVIEAARSAGFKSVNVDLIYGLPRQSVSSFADTVEKVLQLRPDRIALYSYAHVPHLFKPQRRILLEELPPPADKLAILALAIEKLGAAGYVYIGMDHFAKPGDELARAQDQRKLHRNFQGYSTKPDCDLLAFGISAIGKVGRTYVQNVRTLDEYYDRLDARALPAFRGYLLTDDDVVRRDAISRLMCDFDLPIPEFEARHGVVFHRAFAAELLALAPLAADGLVEISPTLIRVTERGRLLVRTVAMVFDRHLREARAAARYSRVI